MLWAVSGREEDPDPQVADPKLVALVDRLVFEAQLGPPTCRDRCPGCRCEFPRAGEEIGVEVGVKDEDNLGAQRLRGRDVPVRIPLGIDYRRGLLGLGDDQIRRISQPLVHEGLHVLRANGVTLRLRPGHGVRGSLPP